MSDLVMNSAVNAAGTASADPSSRYYVKDHHPKNGSSLGFWIYLMSDCLIFACLFATYAVIGRNYAGGPTGAEIFDLNLVALNHGIFVAQFNHLWCGHGGHAKPELEKNHPVACNYRRAGFGLFGG